MLFATPGMLHGGASLEAFRAWAGSAANLVLLPGYCVAGTLGARLQTGAKKGLRVDAHTTLDVKCKV